MQKTKRDRGKEWSSDTGGDWAAAGADSVDRVTMESPIYKSNQEGQKSAEVFRKRRIESVESKASYKCTHIDVKEPQDALVRQNVDHILREWIEHGQSVNFVSNQEVNGVEHAGRSKGEREKERGD